MISYEVDILLDNKKIVQEVLAESKNEAYEIVSEQKNIYILNIRVKKDSWTQMFKYLIFNQYKEKIKKEELILFLQQIYVLLRSGISIYDAIEEILNSSVKSRLNSVFSNVLIHIHSGKTFFESVKPYEYELGIITTSMIEIGEKSNNLKYTLSTLITMLETMQKEKTNFQKITSYPKNVMLVMFIAFFILIHYVLPKFKTLFSQLNNDLPLPTQILLQIEHITKEYGFLLVSIALVLYIALPILLREYKQIKYIYDTVILKTYFISSMTYNKNIYYFVIIFSHLIKIKIPLIEAISLSSKIINNKIIQNKLLNISNDLQKGISVSNSFKNTKLFKPIIVKMISVGENTDQLDTMLEQSTKYYQQNFNNNINYIAQILEPILLSILAIFITILALGLFMPIWSMQSNIAY
jgi:type II secretory pathway component PulF